MKTTIALVGAAHIHTPGFVRKLQARPDIQVKWVWDPEAERAGKNAELLNAAVASAPDQAWEDEAVQAAVITSQTNLHESLVLPAAQAGKHLFVEKPLGMGAADADRMARAIEMAGVAFQTGYFMRGLSEFQFLRQAVQAGHFGEITRIRLSNCHAGALEDWFTPEWRWMADPAVAGVGAFGDLGAHILDILLWLMDSRVQQVTASVETVLGRYGPNCDEYGEGLLRFESGALSVLAAGWVDVADPVRAVVSGTRGHAVWSGSDVFFKSEYVEGADGNTPWTQLPAASKHPLDIFLDALLEGDLSPDYPGLVPVQEAALRNRVMAAMYESASSREWVGI